MIKNTPPFQSISPKNKTDDLPLHIMSTEILCTRHSVCLKTFVSLSACHQIHRTRWNKFTVTLKKKKKKVRKWVMQCSFRGSKSSYPHPSLKFKHNLIQVYVQLNEGLLIPTRRAHCGRLEDWSFCQFFS